MMEKVEYATMYKVEDDHWWYRGMSEISRAILLHWLPGSSNLRILDAGCGTGGNIRNFLPLFGTPTGMDLSLNVLNYCRLRMIDSLACASVGEIPFDAGRFDLVTSFDVLYSASVPDVELALQETARVLVPGGHLLVRVPAYNWLRGSHDIAVHTARRFTASELTCHLRNAGFKVLHHTYANTILFPFALIKRLGERIFPVKDRSSDLTIQFGWLNQFLIIILSLEASLAARFSLPFGLSVFALAQKK
jgi:SAM-dependent methyltransferase